MVIYQIDRKGGGEGGQGQKLFTRTDPGPIIIYCNWGIQRLQQNRWLIYTLKNSGKMNITQDKSWGKKSSGIMIY